MGSLTLPPSGTVYVDANTVIYTVERIEPYNSLLSSHCVMMWAERLAEQSGKEVPLGGT